MAQPTDNIKVVDAEPQPIPTDSGSANQPLNPNVLLNNTLDGFATLSSKFNPFAQKLGKGIGQVRQVTHISFSSFLYILYTTLFLNYLKLN